MKYLVMECHLSYAVVLDEEGHFLKVANRHYEAGQIVTEVIEMQIPQVVPVKKKTNKWIYSLAAMVACLFLIVTSVLQINQMPYASVYMTINPEVRIDVNRNDVVVGLDGINADGEDLIGGYDYRRKGLDTVMDELVDLAIDMGYLHEGGKITLSLDAEEEWIVSHSDHLNDHLNEYLTDKITVIIDIEQEQTSGVPTGPIMIPVDPDYYRGSDYGDDESNDGDSGYDSPDASDSAYESSEDGQSDYNYAADDDGQTDYDDTSNDAGASEDDGAAEEDGQTDYGAMDDAEDGQSNYEVPDSDDSDDGDSGYEESDDDDD